MKKLLDYIQDSKHYIKMFAEWNATEQIIDKNKAFWMLKAPDSEYQKVCLYRDGCNMFVYGDYGQMTFDSMTWLGDVYNLHYNDIRYQMEKLSRQTRDGLNTFDEQKAKKDIMSWFKDTLANSRDIWEDKDINKITRFVKSKCPCNTIYITEFVKKNHFSNKVFKLIEFVSDLLDHAGDSTDFIAFMNNNYDVLEIFDEACESSLWSAGQDIDQRYFICMYALQVCGEKLKVLKEKEANNNE